MNGNITPKKSLKKKMVTELSNPYTSPPVKKMEEVLKKKLAARTRHGLVENSLVKEKVIDLEVAGNDESEPTPKRAKRSGVDRSAHSSQLKPEELSFEEESTKNAEGDETHSGSNSANSITGKEDKKAENDSDEDDSDEEIDEDKEDTKEEKENTNSDNDDENDEDEDEDEEDEDVSIEEEEEDDDDDDEQEGQSDDDETLKKKKLPYYMMDDDQFKKYMECEIIFINLPLSIKERTDIEKVLKEIHIKSKSVLDCHFLRDRFGLSKRICNIRLKTSDQAKHAIETLNGLEIDGNTIRVEYSKTPTAKYTFSDTKIRKPF